MRSNLLLVLLATHLVACATKDGGTGDTDLTGDTDDTDVAAGNDTDGGGTTDTDDATGTDTDDGGTGDTDVAVPFDPAGDWWLSNGVVMNPVNCSGTPTIPADTVLTWVANGGNSLSLSLDGFSDPFQCTQAGDAVTCNGNAYRSNYTGYYVDYTVTLSLALGQTDGQASLTRNDSRVCTATTGTCRAGSECSATFNWIATQQ